MFSPLANRVMETGKRSSRGGTAITRAIVHHWAGTGGGIERLVQSSDEASVHYLILSDGSLIASVPEEYRAWTSGSFEADASAITFEVQNTTTAPEWRVSDAAIATLTHTIADIARRYGWGTVDQARVRGHRDFYATECPGPYLYPRLSQIAADAHKLLTGGGPVVTMASPVVGTVSCEWRGYEGHAGIDIACPIGTPVYAAFAGTVREAGWNDTGTGRSGIGVRVENPDGESQYYGHLSSTLVKPGDRVALGQQIGLSGDTGNVTGPHLHFECWLTGGTYWNGRDADPREWFSYHGVLPGSPNNQSVTTEDEDLNSEQDYKLNEIFKRLAKIDTMNYGFVNSALPALGRLDRGRAETAKAFGELQGKIAGLTEGFSQLAAAKGADIDIDKLTAAIEAAAERGARAGAATVAAEDVAGKLEVKPKES